VTRFVKAPEQYKPIDMQDTLPTTCISGQLLKNEI